MRLDASNGHRAFVWDAKRCCKVERVLWVDDETATWGEYVGLNAARDDIEIVERQEDSIRICHGLFRGRRLVIFNEVEDVEFEVQRILAEMTA